MTQGLDITIKLNEDFISQYNKLQNEYGAYMADINGFGYNQLSYTNFIDNFIDRDTVADSSVDGNSNVSHKDVVTLEREMSKPHMKLIAFNKIYYEIEKKFGFYIANKWMKYEWIGKLYLHDFSSSSKKPYSYRGSETVVAKYRDSAPKIINMSDLYDLVDEPEEILCEEDNAFCKYTNELVVQDSDGWVNVSRVIRHDRTNKFHFIKLQNGLTEVVTDNHPLITTNRGDIDARDAEVEKDSLMTYAPDVEFGGETEVYITKELCNKGYDLLFNGLPATEDSYNKDGQISYYCGSSVMKNRLEINYDFGWLIGFILGDGTFTQDNSTNKGRVISIIQKGGECFDRVIEILNKFNIGYSVRVHNLNSNGDPIYAITIRGRLFCDVVFSLFITNDTQYTRHLNPDILRYTKDFIKGIIGGVIDSDGNVMKNNSRFVIRVTSRHLIEQLSYLIRMFGYNTREATPRVMNWESSYTPIHSRRYIYTLAVTPYSDKEMFSSIKLAKNVDAIHTYAEGAHCRNNKYTSGFDEQIISNNMELDDEYESEDSVYDITTDTGHFICNGILSHNCFAYTLKDVAEKGLFFIDGRSALPAKHLITFVDFVKEFINFSSNRTSGACGLPDLLPYMFYFWKKDVDNDYLGIKTSHNEEYYAKQGFQRFIFAVNQPYTRDGSQSAFTNTSVFDHKYFEALFGGSEFPDGSFMIDYEEEIINFQKWYMEVMSEIRSENMFTFPVSSISLLKNKDNEFEDPEFAEWAIKHNMKWSDSNLFIDDSVTSLSNCCFVGNQLVYINDEIISLKDGYEKFGNKTISTKIDNDKYANAHIIRLPKRPLYKIETETGKIIIATDNHIFPVYIDHSDNTVDIAVKDLNKKYYFYNIEDNSKESIKNIGRFNDYEDDYVYCLEMEDAEYPYFMLPNGILTHNCRLKSNISDLGYFNSIGGTALKVGSVKVNTVNLARVALESDTEEEYIENLRDTVNICLIALDRVRHIIKRNVDKRLLPNFSHGIIDFEHLYNTIGFIGVYETMKKFGYTTTDEFGNVYYTDDAFRFGETIFKEMRKVADDFIEKYNCDYQINTEQIPGESAADKLMRKDKFFYGDANIYDLPLYGNQFIPLGFQTTMKERVKIAAAFDSYCNGGSILHYNIDAPFDSYEKAYEAVKYIMSAGVTYFAFNTKIQVCEDNHAFFGNVCPKCGKPVSAEYTRIVGFYTKIQSWSSKRKEEYKMRKWANSQETHEMVEKER
jgi:anaerobic ribonucleoside-triphosphate reductase